MDNQTLGYLAAMRGSYAKKKEDLPMNDIQKDPNMLATIRVAMDVQTDATFIELVQKVAHIVSSNAQDAVVIDPVTEGLAVDSILLINQTLGELKVLSDKAVAFPKLYATCVKNVFKPLVDQLTPIKEILNGKVLEHQEQIIAATSATISNTGMPAAGQESPPTGELTEEPGAVTVLKTNKDGQLMPPDAPEGVTAKAHVRSTPKLIVLNKFEFIKVIISKQPRNEWATPDLISVDEGAVLKAFLSNGKRSLPNCLEIENKESLVTTAKKRKKSEKK